MSTVEPTGARHANAGVCAVASYVTSEATAATSSGRSAAGPAGGWCTRHTNTSADERRRGTESSRLQSWASIDGGGPCKTELRIFAGRFEYSMVGWAYELSRRNHLLPVAKSSLSSAGGGQFHSFRYGRYQARHEVGHGRFNNI